MNVLKAYAIKRITNRIKVEAMMDQKVHRMKLLSFKILICPEFYASKEQRELDYYEVK